jgi:uncharacterized protein (DUF1330 family)
MVLVNKETPMSAILVSRARLRDPEKMKAYGTAAAQTLLAHGGEVVLRGTFSEAFLGKGAPHATGIMRFRDLEGARSWFNSAEYRALTELREAAAEMEFFLYDAP